MKSFTRDYYTCRLGWLPAVPVLVMPSICTRVKFSGKTCWGFSESNLQQDYVIEAPFHIWEITDC